MPDEIRWHGDKVLSELREVTGEALWLVGQDCLRQAQDNIPLDTGALRRSGHVSVGALPDPGGVYAAAVAGTSMGEEREGSGDVFVSYSTPYAIVQHEGLHIRHLHGGAKWLERALPLAWARLDTMIRRAKRKMGVRW